GVGRDHNPGAMTVWMAGAGIKGGQAIGASDDFGYKAEQQPTSYHDLHATILHLLGVDHKKLTYRFNGRDMRLTDVYGNLIPQIHGWRIRKAAAARAASAETDVLCVLGGRRGETWTRYPCCDPPRRSPSC